MSALLDAALAYARHGWPVFPCHPATKQPLVKTGFKAATVDEKQIRAWWEHMPDALIAAPMGEAIGAFVVDLDIGAPPLIEGIPFLHRFARHVAGDLGLPYTAIAETASGGVHVYFAWDPARPVPRKIRAFPALEIAQPPGPDGKPPLLPNGKRAKSAGIDILGGEAGRGSGGYAILPPSRRADGKEWTWLQEPWDGLAPAPEAVYAAALKDGPREDADDGEAPAPPVTSAARPPADALSDRQRRYALRAFDDEVRAASRAPAGQRNQALFEAALKLGTLVGAGALMEAAVTAALEAAAKECGLWKDDGARAVRATIASGLKAGKDKPRSLPQAEGERADARSQRAASVPAANSGGPRPSRGSEHASAGGGGDEPGLSAETLERLASEPLNDLGNARRLIGHFGSDLVNLREIGLHAWAGTHWEAEGGDEAARRFAHVTGERIALEAPLLPHSKAELEDIERAEQLSGADRALAAGGGPRTAPPLVGGAEEAEAQRRRAEVLAILAAAEAARRALRSRQQGRRKFSVASGNAGRLEAMVKQALPYITLAPEAADADPLAINLINGTLRVVKERVPDPECPDPNEKRLKTVFKVRLDPHRREDRITKLMPCAYDPAAKAERWDAFMARFQPNEAVRRFLQQFHGYALTGLMGLQVFVFNYGTGANGKSTFMEAIARLQGPYAQVLPAEALAGDMQRRGDQATPEFARLPGARLVRAAELPRGQSFRESTIKMLTGGEPMLVRHLHHRFFEFRPTFKAIGSGNDKPHVGGVDEGIWRRMKLVPWPVTIPEKERRPMERVLRDFAAERAGILNWLVDGLLDYLAHGLVTPEEVLAATADYRADMDHVSEFTGACVETQAGARETARDMFLAYTAWCHANSVRPYSERRFSETMATKGFAKARGRIREYLDVRLKDVPEDPERSRQGGLPVDS